MHFLSQYCYTTLLILMVLTASAQSIKTTLKKLEQYQQQTPQEKAYLHTDKEVYVQNETLWFSAYLVDAASFVPSTPSSLLYVDLINPQNKLVSSLPIKIENGSGAGEFLLADSLAEGTYTLMAYTKYMRNFDADYFFSKPIKLFHYNRDTLETAKVKSRSSIDLQLFPEGGQLVNGMANIVAYRATNEKGYGVDIEATIVTSKGAIIDKFATQHLGMGVFLFTPVEGEKYFVKYMLNGKRKSVRFPEAKKSGYQLTVRQDLTKTYIAVKASPGLSFDDCFVLAHVRGKVVAVFRAKQGEAQIYNELIQGQTPSGIVHLTVFKSGNPILERLVYNDNPNEWPVPSITLKNEHLKSREMANFEISHNTVNTPTKAGSLSVSVLKTSDSANKVDIENFLLLTSDLKGTIEHPEYYTNRENPDRLKLINLLMLTHGWRRFEWNNVLEDQLPPISLFPEKGFTIEGRTVNYHDRNNGMKSNIILSFLNALDISLEAETSEDGKFWFDGLQIEDTVSLFIRTVVKEPTKAQIRRAKKKDEGEEIRDRKTYIKINEIKPPSKQVKYLDPFSQKELYRQQIRDVLTMKQVDLEFDEKTIVLEEIEVTAKRDRRSEPYYRNRLLMPYARADSRVIIDSIEWSGMYYDIFNMVIRIFPIVQTQFGDDGLKEFTFRGSKLRVYHEGRRIINNGLLYAINPQMVEFMDLMRGINFIDGEPPPYPPSLFIYYRKKAKHVDKAGIQFKEMYGYYQPAEFYVPKYDIMTAKEKIKPDYRATQYWNPRIKLEDGKASFSFYTSDDTGDFIMYLEGITTDGKILKNKYEFSVN